MGLFAPPSASLTRFFVPESDVQVAGVAASDIPVATFAANARFLITRMSIVIYSTQTVANAGITTGPTVRLISGPTGGTINTNVFPSTVIAGALNAVNDVDVQTGSGGAHRILTETTASSLVVRCTAASGRYTTFRSGFIVEGFYL
jgi:hypothetical protein